MKKILLISLGIILILGVVTISAISLQDYSKIAERTEIDVKGSCEKHVNSHAHPNACGNNNPQSISIQNTSLKIDVLQNNQTNKQILHIYSK